MYAVGRLGRLPRRFLRHLALYTALLILFAVGTGFGVGHQKPVSSAASGFILSMLPAFFRHWRKTRRAWLSAVPLPEGTSRQYSENGRFDGFWGSQ